VPGEHADPFQYAVLRVVPDIARGECLNAGVVLWCRTRGFLAARVQLDRARLRAMARDVDPLPVERHLEGLVRIAAGAAGAGPVAGLEPSERFGWLAAPSSTVVQASPVHTGLSADPARTLERLFAKLVQ